MASLSNINGLFDVHSTGAILFSTSHGTSGQILRSNGNAAPTWVAASTVIGGPYLPLTGGTLSGPLSGTSATFSDNIYLADDEALNFGTSNAFNLRWNSTAASGQGASIIDSNRIFIETNFFQLNSRSGTPRLTISGSTSTFAGKITTSTSTTADNLFSVVQGTAGYASVMQMVAQTDGGAIYNSITSNTTGGSQHWKIWGGAAVNTMAFSTAGTERMRIDSNGDVTIGSSTLTGPRSLTLLSATNATDYDINFQQAGTTNFGRIRFTEGASDFQFFAQVGQDPNLTLQYGGNSFFSRGNVGIGTTSPGAKLQVQGNIGFGDANAGSYNGGSFVNSSSTGIDTNWGIEVQHTSGGVDYNTRLKYYPVSGQSRKAGIYNAQTNSFSLYSDTNNNPNIIIPDGNVGIGTVSPSAKLEVVTAVGGDAIRLNFGQSADIFLGFNSANPRILLQDNSNVVTHNFQSNGDNYIVGSNVGIGTTNPSSELEVAGRAIVEKLEVARYSDSNAPAAVYVGRSANPMGQGGIFRLGAIESSSTVNKIDEPFLITYSSGHWGCQPMFFAEFTITYYRGSYIKYWAQHEVSGSRLEIVDGPYGGQIITGGAPVSRTITQLCTNCHGGQPVYKCVWKWSNSGTYIKTSPIVSLVDGHGSARVYTSGSSSESAIDTLLGSAGSPGPAYLLMGINNAQAAGFTGLQTQN